MVDRHNAKPPRDDGVAVGHVRRSRFVDRRDECPALVSDEAVRELHGRVSEQAEEGVGPLIGKRLCQERVELHRTLRSCCVRNTPS